MSLFLPGNTFVFKSGLSGDGAFGSSEEGLEWRECYVLIVYRIFRAREASGGCQNRAAEVAVSSSCHFC